MIKAWHKVLLASLVGLVLLTGCDDSSKTEDAEKKANASKAEATEQQVEDFKQEDSNGEPQTDGEANVPEKSETP